MLTTSEAATAAGVAPATLRKWVERHHLTRSGRDDAGRPLYDPAAVAAAAALMADRRRRDHQLRHGGQFGAAS